MVTKALSKSGLSNVFNKKLLIFDFDGTLADTSPVHAQAFIETLAPFGIVVDYSKLAGRKTADALLLSFSEAGLANPDPEALAALVYEKQRRVRALISLSLAPFPGVTEFLTWAKARFRTALVTSGSHGTVNLALEKLGWMGWFNPVLFAEDVAYAKPNPEGFLRVLEMTGVSANDALIFEDSEAGFQAASIANIDWLDARQLDWSIPKVGDQ